MKFLRGLVIVLAALFLFSSCCVADWIDDDDELSPGTHSEGTGGDT